jgi:Flp pilus assembly protein TadD
VIGASLSLLVLAMAAPAPPAGGEGCPQARQQLQVRELAGAEVAARTCLASAPEDVATWTVLGRVLAAQGKYDEALDWLGRASARYPHDDEIGAERARVLGWAGRLDDAWQAVQALGEESFADRDVAMLAANLALWRGDDPEADRRFTQILARWPEDGDARRGRGLGRQHAGRLEEAQQDFDALCAQEGPCGLADELGRRLSRVRLRVAPGLTVVTGRKGGWNLAAEAEGRLVGELRVAATLDRRTRDFGAGPLVDTYLEGAASARLGSRGAVALAAGATIDRRDFSPAWTVQVEPSLGVGGGLELMLKYWRISFPAGGAHVVSPAASWQAGDWTAQGRYFLALPDQGTIRHAASGRLGRALGERWTAWAGGGAGNGLDYLELHQGGQGGFWFGWAGLGYRIGWRHSLRADYVHRRETGGGTAYVQHNLTLGYELRL